MKSLLALFASLLFSTLIPATVHGATPAINASDSFTIALHADGSVLTWGDNRYEQLGVAGVSNRSRPGVVQGLSGVASVAAGGRHGVALKDDGTVWTWGGVNLVFANATHRATPEIVPGISNVVAIAAGQFHTIAVKNDGTVWSWSDASMTPAPSQVSGISDVVAVSASNSFTIALKRDGTVWGWGVNPHGNLGDGTFGNVQPPVQAVGLTNVVAIATGGMGAGDFSSFAVKSDGTVWGWGRSFGANGAEYHVPTLIPGISNAVSVAARGFHVFVTRSDGGVVAWGSNYYGQLGNGSSGQLYVAQPVAVGGLEGVAGIAPGLLHSIALMSDGTLRSWGRNNGYYGETFYNGMLGDGTDANRSVPGLVVAPDGQGTLYRDTWYLDLDPATPNSLSPGPVPADVDTDGDGISNAIEANVGRNPLVRDNDVFADAGLFAMQQYRDFLGREGDAGGIAAWSNNIQSGIQSRGEVIESFFGSLEFQGTIAPVARLYFAYFLRIPDYGGLKFWISYYRAGNSIETISNQFTQSPEFASMYGSVNSGQFVDLVYQNVLGRAPDPGGFDFWKGQLDNGIRTRGQVMLGFSESEEYRKSSDSMVYVTMMYFGMMRRAPDQQGFDFWVGYRNQGNSGLALIDAFLGSQEYRGRFLP